METEQIIKNTGPECPICQGSGEVDRPSFSDASKNTKRHCSTCKGQGRLPRDLQEVLQENEAQKTEIEAQKLRISELEKDLESERRKLREATVRIGDLQVIVGELRRKHPIELPEV